MSTTVSGRPWGYSKFWRALSVMVLRPSLHLLINNKHAGRSNIPKKGGVILAPNHISYVDWGTDALFCREAGRYPVFMIKGSMFRVKGIGPFLYKAGQLPVNRGATDAALVLKTAEEALAQGACVIVYPEATATRDPDLWPMVAKTGVARLALATGVPVIPVAQWGAQRILPYGSVRPHLLPRTTVQIVAGPPVDLSAFEGKPLTSPVLREATEVIMKEITGLLAGIRGETPPAEPFHPAVARRKARQEARERDESAVTDASSDSADAEANPT